jgi:hypothetical protein
MLVTMPQQKVRNLAFKIFDSHASKKPVAAGAGWTSKAGIGQQ